MTYEPGEEVFDHLGTSGVILEVVAVDKQGVPMVWIVENDDGQLWTAFEGDFTLGSERDCYE